MVGVDGAVEQRQVDGEQRESEHAAPTPGLRTGAGVWASWMPSPRSGAGGRCATLGVAM